MKALTMNGHIHARAALLRRDENSAHLCAAELANLGFSIVHAGNRGVSFEGPASLFESVFNAPIESSDRGSCFSSLPHIPELLCGRVESVYIPTAPARFP